MSGMGKLSEHIKEIELDLLELVRKDKLSENEENTIGYLMTSILSAYFSQMEKGTGMKGWCVDDMYPDKVTTGKNKLTLEGCIHWLEGGGSFKYYQADIATNTDPILYSIKLKNNRKKQILYIGKTFQGWIQNAT